MVVYSVYIICMTEVVQAVWGTLDIVSITVVGALTRYALLHVVEDLKPTEMNEWCSLNQELGHTTQKNYLEIERLCLVCFLCFDGISSFDLMPNVQFNA